MTPYYADDWLTVMLGDCRQVMAQMEPESVHCVVTSPPYWGLRDYGTATWTGGDEACDHEAARRAIGNSPSSKSTLTTNNGAGPKPGDKFSAGSQSGYAHSCPCGATRIDSQLGLEPTPEAYVESMVAVFREVRRVLRSDGTVWLNLGDSYAAGPDRAIGRLDQDRPIPRTDGRAPSPAGRKTQRSSRRVDMGNLKPKDLVGIPWRVAFALQADGWYLRSDIIWAKPNPMPESVTDRPTKAHEYLFLLSKSPRYYYDADAVRESYSGPMYDGRDNGAILNGDRADRGKTIGMTNPAGRNLRSVWTIATQPYPGAHFATFPQALVEPCIKAGSPEGGVVLDPFAGSGTTGLVAQRLSRRAVLIDLNGEYLEQVMDRNRDIPLGLGA
jgi:DNA modification methylase